MNWGRLFVRAFWSVIVLGLTAMLLGQVFLKGVDTGKDLQRQEYERFGNGRYIEVMLDGHNYKGWLR